MSVEETKKEISQSQNSKLSVEWKDVPLKYQSALSVVLIFFAALLLLPSPGVDKNAPIFQSAREEVSMKKCNKGTLERLYMLTSFLSDRAAFRCKSIKRSANPLWYSTWSDGCIVERMHPFATY